MRPTNNIDTSLRRWNRLKRTTQKKPSELGHRDHFGMEEEGGSKTRPPQFRTLLGAFKRRIFRGETRSESYTLDGCKKRRQSTQRKKRGVTIGRLHKNKSVL